PLLSSPPPFIYHPSLLSAMLWVVAPFTAATSLALAVGCAKGRDVSWRIPYPRGDHKLAKTQRSSGSRKDVTRSGKSTRSAKNGKAGGSKSARAGGSSRSGRAGDKSGRSGRSPRDKSGERSSRAGSKSNRSGRSRFSSSKRAVAAAAATKHPTGKPPKGPSMASKRSGSKEMIGGSKEKIGGSKEQLSGSGREKKKALVVGAAGGPSNAGGKVAMAPKSGEQKSSQQQRSSQREKRYTGSEEGGRCGCTRCSRCTRRSCCSQEGEVGSVEQESQEQQIGSQEGKLPQQPSLQEIQSGEEDGHPSRRRQQLRSHCIGNRQGCSRCCDCRPCGWSCPEDRLCASSGHALRAVRASLQCHWRNPEGHHRQFERQAKGHQGEVL
ncbi:hypothetical protein PMAYCL1PPCAC_28531, partial [Pristionchus mayeri]